MEAHPHWCSFAQYSHINTNKILELGNHLPAEEMIAIILDVATEEK
jgi:hypothetical protein